MCRIAGPISPNASIIGSLIERAPASAPGDEQHRAVGRQLEDLARLVLRDRARAGRDRPADDAEARLVPALERVGEEDALRERKRQPVREPEVRVGLGERRRDAHRRGGEHHRPGDVAAAAVDDVGAPALRRIARQARGATPAR